MPRMDATGRRSITRSTATDRSTVVNRFIEGLAGVAIEGAALRQDAMNLLDPTGEHKNLNASAAAIPLQSLAAHEKRSLSCREGGFPTTEVTIEAAHRNPCSTTREAASHLLVTH